MFNTKTITRIRTIVVSRQAFDQLIKDGEIPDTDTFAYYIDTVVGDHLGELQEDSCEILSLTQAFDPSGDCYCSILFKEVEI